MTENDRVIAALDKLLSVGRVEIVIKDDTMSNKSWYHVTVIPPRRCSPGPWHPWIARGSTKRIALEQCLKLLRDI